MWKYRHLVMTALKHYVCSTVKKKETLHGKQKTMRLTHYEKEIYFGSLIYKSKVQENTVQKTEEK